VGVFGRIYLWAPVGIFPCPGGGWLPFSPDAVICPERKNRPWLGSNPTPLPLGHSVPHYYYYYIQG